MANIVLNNYSDDSRIKEYIQQNLMTRVFHNIPLNVLNTGAFSIISEYISQVTEQMAFTSSFYFNESFITKAVLPDSIYAEAAIFNIGYAFATPSCTNILLELRINDLIKNATYNADTGFYEFTLDRDTMFNLPNGNVYSLDYDILFQFTDEVTATGDRGWSVQYVNYEPNMCAVNKNRYIVYRVTDNWLCLFINASEYKRTKYLVVNSNAQRIPNEDYLIQIDGHICGFDVTYIDPKGNRKPLSRDHILSIHDDVKDLEPYVHYIMDNPQTIRLMFQLAGTHFFIPAINSQFEIIVYTSHGIAANFTEAPNVQPSVITATSKYPNNANVSKAAFIISGSLGGTDIGNTETIRRETIEAYNTANVISTDHDIDEWFKTFYFKNILYPYFYKRRDDPWGRIWSGFLALKDDNNHVYRTNTLHAKIPYHTLYHNSDNTITDNELVIPPGWVWIYSGENNWTVNPYVPSGSDVIETANTLTSIPEKFVFANPFGVKIQKEPFAIAYFNPWVDIVTAPARLPSSDMISWKDLQENDVARTYHATPIDMEIIRTYKDNFYRFRTYIDVSQLTTVDGKGWVSRLMNGVAPPQISDQMWFYFHKPLDLYGSEIPMLPHLTSEGILPFDPEKTFLCVRERNFRSDGTITLADIWIQDETNVNEIKKIDIGITNVSYLFGTDALWGNEGMCEPVMVTGNTAIQCYNLGNDDLFELFSFTRSGTSDYYVLKLKQDLVLPNPDDENAVQSIRITNINISAENVKKTSRRKFGVDGTIWNVGNPYRDATLNIHVEYVFLYTNENGDVIDSSHKGHKDYACTIRNAVYTCLPYGMNEPDVENGYSVFQYPLEDAGQDEVYGGTILAYATMKASSTSGSIDYYRLPFNLLTANVAMFYLKSDAFPLEENQMRVLLRTYMNGRETGRVEMLPVSRESDGAYLFQADMYPLTEMLDVDNIIRIASLEYGGGNWISTNKNTYVTLHAISPEIRLSILFKTHNSLDRPSDIEIGDQYTGYIINDEYELRDISLVQELKEMRSVVHFDYGALPTTLQINLYDKCMRFFDYATTGSIYDLYDLAYHTMLEKIKLTSDQQTIFAGTCTTVKDALHTLYDELYALQNIAFSEEAITQLTTGVQHFNDAFDLLISESYEQYFTYDDEGLQVIYTSSNEEHVFYLDEQHYEPLVYQETYDDMLFVVKEHLQLDRFYRFNEEHELQEVNGIVIWEDMYDLFHGYKEFMNSFFQETNVNGGVEIQLMPFVEYSLLKSDKFKDFVKTFTQVHKAIEPVIFKRLEGNNYLDCKLIATYGLPHTYCSDQQYYSGNESLFWPDLNVQVSFNVKLYNRALATNTKNELREIVRDYFNRLTTVHTPRQLVTMNNNIYISHVIQRMEEHDNVAYMKFNGWYTNEKNIANGNYMGPEHQSIVSRWRKLEDMPTDELERYVPEMFVLDDENIEINIIDDNIIA